MSSHDDLEREIEQTREHLAETVDALTDKLDVKAHAADAAKNRRNQAIAGGVVVVVVAFVIWRRRRRS